MTDSATTTDKRSAILNATLDLIAERGFHGTPMSLVAKRSGVSTGIIYHYFENKDALIHELYTDIKARFSSALLRGNPQALAWPEVFEQLWLNAYHFYVENPKQTGVLEQYENSPFAQHWHEETLRESGDENMIALMEMMEAKLAEGVVRKMPFVAFYELTFGVALGLAKRQIYGAVALDDGTLHTIATACRRAIESD
jgi:AcrR family transcriptional regulator